MEELPLAPDKMKVVELRAALSQRGLSTDGVKKILVARLKDYMDEEVATAAKLAAAATCTSAKPHPADQKKM